MREDDFPSLREYNDYLEEVEDMSKPFSHLLVLQFPGIIKQFK
jgi:CDK-activating kinase assembly factor MAT1